MGIKDKMMASMMNDTTKSLAKVLESIHAHLEIQTKELIRTRLENKTSREVNDEEVETILRNYQNDLI